MVNGENTGLVLRNRAIAPVDWASMRAYLHFILLSLLAISSLGIRRWIGAIGALLHLYEGFLILVCQRDPALQLGVKLKLGTVRLLDCDVLAVQLGEGDAIIILKKCWICWEGEDLRNWLLCHFVWGGVRLLSNQS